MSVSCHCKTNSPLYRGMKPKYPHKTTYHLLYHIRLYRVHLFPVTTNYIANCKSNYHIWRTGPALSHWINCSQSGPALNGLALELYTLICSGTHNNTLLHVLQRTALDPAPLKTGPDDGRVVHLLCKVNEYWC